MDVCVLGPLKASVEGRPLALGGGKPRALLAMLALNAGSTVSTGRLIDGLWGEEPPATAAKMVQVYVSQLRKALAASGDGAEIVTRGRGYELRLGPDDLDLERFERLMARGAPREALALWRGPPLDDVAEEPFAAAEIRRLEELRLAALELAIERDLAAGRQGEVIGELEVLVVEEPLRERLHAQRMLALYRCGRQADALEAYRQARAALVEQIGIEPGPELRRLHEAILRQDPALDLPAEEAVELPPELDAGTPLVGREAELASLREHWRHAHGGAGRIVLIAAARGMGKTRLAAELAAEVHRDRGAVRYASGAGAPNAARAALEDAGAARRPTLLVLDDVDQAAEEVRAALDALAGGLAALPVLVLATAEDDGLPADATLALGPLDADGVRAVARLYAGPPAETELPVGRLVAESGGVPQRVHRAASEWARTEAARRLGATAERAAAERTGLRATEDDLAGNVVQLQAVRERAELRDALPKVVACPFKGLASFDVDDADVFFGRERLVAEMVARIVGAPLVGIVGPSGSGKSSALRAGLLAALRGDVIPGSKDWALALLRPGEHPRAALEQATAEAAPQGRLIVAVDQFEEAFTACRDEHECSAFVDALVASARDPRRRALVLLAIRADFYGRCASYPELWRLLGANQVPVGPMRRDELRRAIELPARRSSLHVEPELVDALIADVEGEPGALPLLSTSLLELWQHRDGRRLHMSAYRQAGGVHGAVARLAERTYEQLKPAHREVARRILLRLAGEGEREGGLLVRRRVELIELEGERNDGVADVLSVLADDRLVTIDEGEVEVAHEALLREWPRLRGWLEEDAQGRRLHHQLRNAAREWDASGRDPGELYRGARLASTLDWAADHEADLSATERAFLAESRAASERSQRRLRAVLAGVAALLVLAVIAGAIALEQRANARDEATAAEAQRLGARALLDDQLDRSLLLARQGVALDDTVRTRGNLLGALLRSPAAIGIIRADHATILSAAVSPDGRTLAVGNISGEVLFLDTQTRRRVATLEPAPNEPAVQALAYSPDGSRLAVAYTNVPGLTAEYPAGWRFLVALVDGRTRRVIERIEMPKEQAVAGVQFSPDGRTLGVTLHYGQVPALRRFDARTGRRSGAPVPFEHPGRLTFDPFQTWPRSPVMIASDGRRVVVGGKDGVTVRDAATLSLLTRFPAAGKGAIRTQPTAYALSGDDRTVAIGGEDGSLRLLDLSSDKLQTASGRHRAAVNEARFTPDGRTLVTTGEDGDVLLWDVRQAAAAETLSGHARSAFSPQIADDGKTLYTASLDGTVLIWDLVGSRRLGRRFTAGAANNGRYSLSSDGRLLAHGQPDGAVSLVDMRTLTPRGAFPVVRESGIFGAGSVEGMRFVPGSHLLVVGGTYGSVSLVDADRGQVLRRLDGHSAKFNTRGTVTDNPIWEPGMSADGSLLATGSKDGMVRFWSLPDGRAQGAPLRFPYGNAEAQLSPNGRWLSVVPLNRDVVQDRLEIWDVRRRQRVRTLRPPAGVFTGRFSPDGRFLAVGDQRGRVQVYSTATWKPVTPSFAGGRAVWVAFTPNGRTLATGNSDGTVRLWDVASGQALGAPLPGVPHSTAAPMFTPDGRHLIAGHENGRAYRWDIRHGSLVRQACRVAGRRLTRAEWDQFLPGREYEPAC
jgi:WD40 repeat protein/DNA-binding SARP family transcriptional activator